MHFHRFLSIMTWFYKAKNFFRNFVPTQELFYHHKNGFSSNFVINKILLLEWFDVFHTRNEFPKMSRPVWDFNGFYRKALHRRRIDILAVPSRIFTKNTKSPQRNFRFQKQNSGICFILSGNVLLTETNLSELFFRLRKCRKYPKKTDFFSQNLQIYEF